MVFLAGKSPYIRSIYGADIRFWPTLPKTHPLLDALEILRSSLLCLNFAVSLAAHLPYLCEHAHKKKGQVSSPPAPPSCTHTHTHTHTHTTTTTTTKPVSTYPTTLYSCMQNKWTKKNIFLVSSKRTGQACL